MLRYWRQSNSVSYGNATKKVIARCAGNVSVSREKGLSRK